MSLTCPIWVTRREGDKKMHGRYPCNEPALEYEVKAQSYSVRQVMCYRHAEKARKENFVLTEIKVPTHA
jgi:hypothetical protein